MHNLASARRVGLMTAVVFALTGCEMPALGEWRPGPGDDRASASAPSDRGDDPALAASEAEAACLAQGREQGFDVESVIGSRVQRGTDDQPVARDVMLRVARDGRRFDLRCHYHHASATARIMTL